ncbi:MAG TPA: LacI family DNA-binding transcriptional regulator, partial [Streptosporangiaceae bacterium]|nr:LacI family DNA-binding transcriptional regulator [Streptosporangiaceae bacterium]
TKAAVSFALNGQPGVSEATRQRILGIAGELGFQRNSAARALSGGRAGAFGLVIDRPARTLSVEPYFMQLISGIQAELSGDSVLSGDALLSGDHLALLFTMAEDTQAEIELYRTWWAQRRVDGVFLVDLQVGDRRIAVIRDLGLPAIVIGSPKGSGSLPTVWQNDTAAMEMVVGYLAGLGHTRLARVGGIARYWHSKLRGEAFTSVTRQAGLRTVSVDADYTSEHGADATRRLLQQGGLGGLPPTAIVYDNDLMALAGLAVAKQLGIDVPGELSIVAWDDSALCELVHPPLTALRRDIVAAGTQAARQLRLLAAGGEVSDFEEPPPVLTERGSTGAPHG